MGLQKNIGIKPCDVKPVSHLKVWWICKNCKHEWETSISSRVAGNGCPECAKQLGSKKRISTLIQKKGSLQSVKPDIAKEWHLTKMVL